MAGPVVHFVVLRDFQAVVNGTMNRYREGMHYHARAGDLWDDLRSKIPAWERAKMVAVGIEAAAEIIGPAAPVAHGRATVTRS